MILMIVGLSLASDRFLTTQNFTNIFRQASINGIISIGMLLVILTAGIDLSVGSVLALSVVVTAELLVQGISPFVAVPGGIALGCGLGYISGNLVSRVGVPPFMATLGMMSFARGMALAFSGGKPITGFPDSFRFLGVGTLLGFPMPIIVVCVIFVFGFLLLSKTRVGTAIYAVGNNKEAAHFTGIDVKKHMNFVYAVCGGLSALAGMVLIARLDSAQPVIGVGYEFDAIAAVVIGGCSLAGGEGKVQGTLMGVLIIAMLNNGLNLLNVSSFYEQIVKGVVIALALILHGVVRRLKTE